MAGIYVHIPFCKQACHYCDFHFSTQLKYTAPLVAAIGREIEIQKGYLNGETVETVYFGGGTPSVVGEQQLATIFDHLHRHFSISPQAEITLEANPDDLDKGKIESLQSMGVNRLSIGIQTFNDGFLQWMNRAHNSGQAESAVRLAQNAGIENITIDLIYGIPAENHRQWASDMEKALALGVKHISAYGLTIEPQTAFGKWKKQGKLAEAGDDFAAVQFEMLMQQLAENGFIHYEISNFGKEGWFSRHNSAYWKGVPYLGLGPSAHSYNGMDRQYNVANNATYIRSLEENKIPFTVEKLSESERANEYIMTGLRTIWGIDTEHIYSINGLNISEFEKTLAHYMGLGHLQKNGKNIILTHKGKFIADRIISDLFF